MFSASHVKGLLSAYIVIVMLLISIFIIPINSEANEDKIDINDAYWSCPRGNAQNTGLSRFDTSDNPGRLMWNRNIGSGDITLIGSDGTFYSGSDNLRATNPDGTEKWTFEIQDVSIKASVIGPDGTIYADTNSNYLLAVNLDGTEKWKFEFNTDKIYDPTPMIGNDGTIYFQICSGWSHGSSSYLYAINPNGTEKWKFETSLSLIDSQALGFEGTIYLGAGTTGIYAINPDGTKKWFVNTDTYDDWSSLKSEKLRTSPAVGPDGTIYFAAAGHIGANYWKRVYALNPSFGIKKWTYEISGHEIEELAIGPSGSIYAVVDDTLHAISPEGKLKWKYNAQNTAEYMRSPVIGYEGTIYVPWASYITALNPDGSEKWMYTHQEGFGGYLSPAIGSNGTIYFSSDGILYAIGNGPEVVDDPVVDDKNEGDEDDRMITTDMALYSSLIIIVCIFIIIFFFHKKKQKKKVSPDIEKSDG
jgi:hypothetical protein